MLHDHWLHCYLAPRAGAWATATQYQSGRFNCSHSFPPSSGGGTSQIKVWCGCWPGVLSWLIHTALPLHLPGTVLLYKDTRPVTPGPTLGTVFELR